MRTKTLSSRCDAHPALLGVDSPRTWRATLFDSPWAGKALDAFRSGVFS